MSNTNKTKTIYLVIVNRFSNVSKDISTCVLTYDNKDDAEAHAKKMLEETNYNTLRFAVSVMPLNITTLDPRFVYIDHPVGYLETKLANNIYQIIPIDIPSNDQDKK